MYLQPLVGLMQRVKLGRHPLRTRPQQPSLQARTPGVNWTLPTEKCHRKSWFIFLHFSSSPLCPYSAFSPFCSTDYFHQPKVCSTLSFNRKGSALEPPSLPRGGKWVTVGSVGGVWIVLWLPRGLCSQEKLRSTWLEGVKVRMRKWKGWLIVEAGIADQIEVQVGNPCGNSQNTPGQYLDDCGL